MAKPIVRVLALILAASAAAVPLRSSHAQPPGGGPTIELFDETKKSIKLACDRIDINAVRYEDQAQSSSPPAVQVSCQMSLNPTTAELLSILTKGTRLPRAVVDVGRSQGRAYRMELSEVSIENCAFSKQGEGPPSFEMSLGARGIELTTARK